MAPSTLAPDDRVRQIQLVMVSRFAGDTQPGPPRCAKVLSRRAISNARAGKASVVTGAISPGRELDDVPLAGVAEGTPAPALGFCNARASGRSFWSRRQPAMEAAARLSKLNPHHTCPARSGFGATARSIFAPGLPTEGCDHSRVSNRRTRYKSGAHSSHNSVPFTR